MEIKISRCPHVAHVGHITRKDVLFCKEKACLGCGYSGGNKWLCLANECLYVGCGKKQKDHSGQHSSEHNHELQLNVKNSRIWCNVCSAEVFPRNNIPTWEEGELLISDRKSKQQQQRQQSSTPSLASLVENDARIRQNSETKLLNVDASNVASIHKSNSVSNADEETLHRKIPPKTYSAVPSSYPQGRLYRDRENPTAVVSYGGEFLDHQAPGLVGLRNLGNTCYMNAALQALSNCPPLTEYFFSCRLSVEPQIRCLAGVYQKLVCEMWDERKRPAYLVPVDVLHAVRCIYPSFRLYQQQDAQEFLRCFLDALHEDIKQPVFEWECSEEEFKRGRVLSEPETSSGPPSSPDDEKFRTCDSGWSSDRETIKSSRNPESGSSSMKLRRRAAKSECQEVKSDSSEFSEAQSEFSALSSSTVNSKRMATKRRTNVRYSPERVPKKKPVRFRSVVSDVFDGKLLSAVQCLTCNTVSETCETFQDLSLSIPTREQLEMLKNSRRIENQINSATTSNGGWLSWTYSWFRSWMCGPSISLEDCLAAFFSADDLKGDDMYSCERCKKLRNGVKYCSLLRLPEILCIHLKRFRHEAVYSSKVSTYVSFPMEKLNLTNFVDKNSTSEMKTYDLVSVICHRGGVDGGHYTAYCLNPVNLRWYEFDDQFASEVDAAVVQNSEAYVLFYRKNNERIEPFRQEVATQLDSKQPWPNKYYISREWIHRFNTFAEPGPITNFDFLCPHGWISPAKAEYLSETYAIVPSKAWHILYKQFGGGPVCSQLLHCFECQQQRQRMIKNLSFRYL